MIRHVWSLRYVNYYKSAFRELALHMGYHKRPHRKLAKARTWKNLASWWVNFLKLYTFTFVIQWCFEIFLEDCHEDVDVMFRHQISFKNHMKIGGIYWIIVGHCSLLKTKQDAINYVESFETWHAQRREAHSMRLKYCWLRQNI